MTNSRGLLVFSLVENRKVSDEVAWFRSRIDGSLRCFTPAMVVRAQEQLGTDMIALLDERAEPVQGHPSDLRCSRSLCGFSQLS